MRIATSDQEVEALRNYWARWCNHPGCDIDHFLNENRLHSTVLRSHVIVVERNGRPDCMLLGRLLEERFPLSFGGTKVTLPRVRMVRFLRQGFLGSQSPENAELLVNALLESTKQRDVDLVELRSIPVESALFAYALQQPSWFSRDSLIMESPRYQVTIPESAAKFSSDLPRKTRQQLSRQFRHLEREFAGDIQVQCLSSLPDFDHLLNVAARISGNTYQGELGTGFVNTPAIREELACDLEKRRLRGYVLVAGGTPCAFLIGKQFNETYYVRFMGYDPAFSAYSPGLLLLQRVIEDLISCRQLLGINRLDLGNGDLRYKRGFADKHWQEATLYIYAPSVRGLLIKALKTTVVAAYRLAKYVVDRTDHRDAFIRKWRQFQVFSKKTVAAKRG